MYALKLCLCFIWEPHEIQTLNLSLYYSWLIASRTVNIMVDSLVLTSRSTHMFGQLLCRLHWACSLFVCRSFVVKGAVCLD